MTVGPRGREPVAYGPAAGDHVVFDLGGVLVDWNPRYLYCGHLGGDPAEVETFLTTVCGREWHEALDRGAPFASQAARLVERFPAYEAWIGDYVTLWERMFAGQFPHAVTVLEELSRRGCRLHALSNYPAEKLAFLYRAFPFMGTFHTVVISGLLGMIKPDPRIFEYLKRVVGEGRCWFIDDRPENVAAARECGLSAIRYAALEEPEALGRALGCGE